MIEVANTIFELVGWRPREIFFDTSKPTGAVSRALDIRKAREELGWEPKVSFRDGLEETIDWYLATHNGSTPTDERILLERAGNGGAADHRREALSAANRGRHRGPQRGR